ncbi:hypothetical protein NC651_032988 [Populus alba x Populus x berolinensis]|nr:hypothetical protein NC651_032988 [Populus alba x Populus x berolinensis]
MQLLSFQLLQPQWTDCLLFFLRQDLRLMPFLPQRIRIPRCLPSKPLSPQLNTILWCLLLARLQYLLSPLHLPHQHRWFLLMV